MYNEGWDNSWSNITIDASISIQNTWTIAATGIASSVRSSGSSIQKRHTVTDTTTLYSYYEAGYNEGNAHGAGQVWSNLGISSVDESTKVVTFYTVWDGVTYSGSLGY